MSRNKERFALMALGLFLATAMIGAQAAADLTAEIKCPGSATPGEELGKSIRVIVMNNGQVAAARFAVDIVLSSDTNVPVAYAAYSANYTEDCLLQGGREHEFDLAAASSRNVTMNGNNRIPADTPPGIYYLAAVIDPGDEVKESNERNNVAFCRIKIGKKLQLLQTPSLVTPSLQRLTVPVPVQISPRDGAKMTHYPRKVRLRWKPVPQAKYDVEVDCLHCRTVGQWDSQNGAPWKTANGINRSYYEFVFVGDNQGRWRVRAVRGKAKSDWSPWWGFSFDTSGAETEQPATAKPDLGMYGFMKIGKNKRQVKWGQSITLTPADATLISNGKPAFEIYYSCREYAGYPGGPFKNKIYFRGDMVSKQTKLYLKPKQIMPIHTQAYLGPQDGRLEIKIDADNDVAESREDNNFHFYVTLRFKGFPTAEQSPRLPDLVVKDISLVQDCKMKVTIANVGAGGVPPAGYDMSNGVGIQMYRFSDPWGGIRLGAVDPGGNLKSPGGTVSWIWFPGAANLNLTPGVQSIKVVVDNNNAVTESNESNNHLTRRLNCQQEADEPESGQPCGIRLDRLSSTRGRVGSEFRMYGLWGSSQGTKIPCINKGGMNKLIVKRWTSTTLVVQVPPGLTPGFYKVGVYCSDPAAGTTYSSGWLDFRVY